MNLISEADEPEIKRLKSENDHEKKSCDQKEIGMVGYYPPMEEDNVQEDIPDVREISPQREREKRKRLADSDNEASAIVDSDDELFTFPPDEDISDMLDEVQYSGYFPTVTDRYFTPYYKVDVQSLGDDMCIWIHSNRICMLSLAPSHVILRDNKDIKKVDFKISDKLDRSLNKVSGKGKLVEVNEALLEDPQLLKESPHKGGYLAIVLPNLKLLESLKQSLLTHDQYTELIKKKEGKQ
ncbi:protein Abitram isoform X2 [Solenopsis invicta]|uniref:protein Abitram isoform X2 n=1 Tax=Solenopsis invicta TaxID=13686 RepID=UPI000596099D|nr:protein Abitram isoform X2 [Solenopsis invicta]